MRFFFFVALVVAALVWGGYHALLQIGLIDEGCPSVSAQGAQVVIDNRLPVDLRVIVHDSTRNELRVVARRCVAVDIVRLKVSVESWPFNAGGMANCLVELLPAQKVTIYDRGGLTYCDVGRADIELGG